MPTKRTTAPAGSLPPERPRSRDTRLESEGAEFLVLGSLLVEGIPAWKAYTNFPGYDVIAGNIGKQRLCRIQVKSRYATGDAGFPISNFDCDFVCFVRLNRGSRSYLSQVANGRRPAEIEDGRLPPEIFVLPKRVVKNAWIPGAPWGRGGVLLKNIHRPERYLNAWERVSDFLAAAPRRR